MTNAIRAQYVEIVERHKDVINKIDEFKKSMLEVFELVEHLNAVLTQKHEQVMIIGSKDDGIVQSPTALEEFAEWVTVWSSLLKKMQWKIYFKGKNRLIILA